MRTDGRSADLEDDDATIRVVFILVRVLRPASRATRSRVPLEWKLQAWSVFLTLLALPLFPLSDLFDDERR